MKLVVGLGNPGKEYEKTRHNMGFMVLDYYAMKHGFSFQKEKFHGLYFETIIQGEKVIFLKPQSYINLSGEVISKFVDYYKISISDIFVIHDDLDLPFTKMKLKKSGSSGGHNGLKNIELHLHTKDYKRLKIGISNDKKMDTKDYVLGKFDDLKNLEEVINRAYLILEDHFLLSFDNLMNRYNS